jgi:predicted ATPase
VGTASGYLCLVVACQGLIIPTDDLPSMKIAVSGAHRTGKTTLIEELSRALPAYVVVDEPYYVLEEEGHEFAEMPSLEDFELQLERSLESMVDSRRDQLFDRCPADILAYLITHRDSDGFDLDLWLPRVRNAMRRLDLIVFVPVESPDRVIVSEPEERTLRRRVDEELRDIVLEDRWDFGVEAIEVTGASRDRARQVLAHVAGGA